MQIGNGGFVYLPTMSQFLSPAAPIGSFIPGVALRPAFRRKKALPCVPSLW